MDCWGVQLSRAEGALIATWPTGAGALLGFPKRKNSSEVKKYRSVLRKSAKRYHESQLFSTPSTPCHSKKQSFINRTRVKLISLIRSFCAGRALYE